MNSSQHSNFLLPFFETVQQPQPSEKIKTTLDLIDFNAANNAGHLFCLQLENPSICPALGKPIAVTFEIFRNMILRCQSWILGNISEAQMPTLTEGEVVKGRAIALLMESDIGLITYLFAVMGLGIPVVLISARLSPTALYSLLAETQSCAIITSPVLESVVLEALAIYTSESTPPTLYSRVSYLKFMKGSNTTEGQPRVAWQNHYTNDLDRNVLILHSSGTTGMPKAVPQSHRYLLSYAPYSSFEFDSRWSAQDEQKAIAFSTLPLYHCYGLLGPMISLSTGKPFAIPPANRIPCATSTLECVDAVNARTLLIVPSILQAIMDLPNGKGLEALRKLDCVITGGGPLSKGTGDELVKERVKLMSGYGSTELGSLGVLRPSLDRDWDFFRLRQDRMCSVEEVHNSNMEDERHYRLRVRPPGWTEDFDSSDIFVTSNERPGRDFRLTHRIDDIIVLATGEKVQPSILETLLSQHADVQAALACGSGRVYLGVLVEPKQSIKQEDYITLRQRIWPVVVEAGRQMDAYARIWSDTVLIILQPYQSFPRSAKGSILRQASYEKFRNEIDRAYKPIEDLMPSVDAPAPDNLESILLRYVQDHIWAPHAKLPSITDDLFKLGMDSQQATQLHHFVVLQSQNSPELRANDVNIPNDLVYLQSSISKIAAYLRSPRYKASRSKISYEDLMNKYVIASWPMKVNSNAGATVLLTGGSGALGCHLLAQLAAHSGVDRIICLNRRHRSLEPHTRQFMCNDTKGAPIHFSVIDKIDILCSDTTRKDLGLSNAIYGRLASSVTHILHSAFQIDLLRGEDHFSSQYTTMANLLYLATQCMSTPKFMFVSSIAAVEQYQSPILTTGPVLVPEQLFGSDWKLPSLGYGTAKLVCEKMLEQATNSHGINGIIVRCGQISGSKTNGFWNEKEFVPIMLNLSRRMGALPSLEGIISWLPLEDAATVLSEVLVASPPSSEETRMTVYHVQNFNYQAWSDIMQLFSIVLQLPTISHRTWLEGIRKLKRDEQNAMVMLLNEKYLHICNGLLGLSTRLARKVSNTLRRAEPVKADVVKGYAWQHLRTVRP
ncbi:hypothetical protein GQ44DRAFT_692722 [Phaeosphaeriaceae sp. PMI808]|nr:hypothetical protein GQ44DRAFT_692722 [Phaeosphaeriaceae sp. PMI808]